MIRYNFGFWLLLIYVAIIVFNFRKKKINKSQILIKFCLILIVSIYSIFI